MPTEPATPEQSPAVTTSGRQRTRQSFWILLLSVALAAALLYLTLRGLDWAAFWKTITAGRYELILFVIPIASINYFIRALRWSVLVRAEADVSVISVFWANMVGYLGNAFLPARAGEVLRSAFLGSRSGLGTSYVLATALTERLLDVVALLLLGTASLLLETTLSPIFAGGLRLLVLVAILGLIAIVVAPFQEKRLAQVAAQLPGPADLRQWISAQVSRFLLGVRSLHNGTRLAAFITLTFLIWFIDAAGTTVGVGIVSQHLSVMQAFVLLAGLGLSSAIPSTPGYVGVYQFVAVSVLVPFGFARADALAYILIAQVLNYLVVGFWGLLGLWQFQRRSGAREPEGSPR